MSQHYAMKALENIASQGGEWAGLFATPDIVSRLLGVLRASKTEAVRATAVSALSRLLRTSQELLDAAIGRWGHGFIVSGAFVCVCVCTCMLAWQYGTLSPLPAFSCLFGTSRVRPEPKPSYPLSPVMCYSLPSPR